MNELKTVANGTEPTPLHRHRPPTRAHPPAVCATLSRPRNAPSSADGHLTVTVRPMLSTTPHPRRIAMLAQPYLSAYGSPRVPPRPEKRQRTISQPSRTRPATTLATGGTCARSHGAAQSAHEQIQARWPHCPSAGGGEMLCISKVNGIASQIKEFTVQAGVTQQNNPIFMMKCHSLDVGQQGV